jgi:hypothetical protein
MVNVAIQTTANINQNAQIGKTMLLAKALWVQVNSLQQMLIANEY